MMRCDRQMRIGNYIANELRRGKGEREREREREEKKEGQIERNADKQAIAK